MDWVQTVKFQPCSPHVASQGISPYLSRMNSKTRCYKLTAAGVSQVRYQAKPRLAKKSYFFAYYHCRLKTGKYNTSVTLYSEETLMELSSSGGHGFVE